ncbi:hypothetical protein BEH_11705 [Priestia filamentosa]|uniref:DUF2213 domain-containing protein n=1 Tax=Priestia filamentosa TaxID=1402861 RepID=A0A0H4KK86_9BACI|nr:DUF2213 domain-containing protein [Priestia filamentosa]AKO92699.1 hypothetical protein BEH_11705 [Priestia filamentosa]
MKTQRFDKALIQDYDETSEGYLTVTVPITRPGVFPYQRSDGTIQMEAKLPDEIFKESTIRSARSKPVTDDHPNEPVTIDNYNRYAKGLSHTDAAVRNLKLYVSMTITDKALIQKIRDGKREISIGFLSDVVAEKGTYNGDNYEYVQRNLEINHIAIVDQGRAGPEVAIRNDSDAWQIDSNNKGGNGEMPTYKIDGKEYEVDSAVKSHLEVQAAQLETANIKVKDYDGLKGRYDALEIQLNNTKQELKDAKENTFSADELDAKVEARVELLNSAKTLLGDSFDFKGKTEREIKEAVIQKSKPDFKGDGQSDEYVNAFFDFTVGQVKQEGFSSTGSNHMFTGDNGNGSKVQDMKNQRLNMNK